MALLDLVVVVGWLALSTGVGFWLGRQASPTLEGFLVADRNLPWWIVGTSMVATTFAADTPLVVAGYVATGGILANWNWWWMGAAGMVGMYLFAPLWRRSGVLTDIELTELRYAGPSASLLRLLKAVWFGIFINVLTIAWVMGAMRKIVNTVIDLPPTLAGLPPDLAIVGLLFLLTVSYTAAAGFYGVVATDVLQFVLAMTGSVLLAVLAWQHAGGLDGIHQGWTAHGLDPIMATQLLPVPDTVPDGQFAQWLVLMGITWWSSKQIDGGGYLAQRLFAARNEQHATWAYLWFTIAHICVRPWPWVIVGLVGVATLGAVDDPETLYPSMMVALLPPGVFGLVLAGFLAAFMSTIDTQLHWGASLVVRDIWQRFIDPDASSQRLLAVSRASVVALALLGAFGALQIDRLGGAWELAFSVTAGLGTVTIARWYWWRTNAWSELAAMGYAAAATWVLSHHGTSLTASLGLPEGWVRFPFNTAFITFTGLPLWVGITWMTAPVPSDHLRRFVTRVRPGGPGWTRFQDMASGPSAAHLVGIVGGILLVYGILLGTGGILLHVTTSSLWGATGALIGAAMTRWALRTIASSEQHGETP